MYFNWADDRTVRVIPAILGNSPWHNLGKYIRHIRNFEKLENCLIHDL
jgi:hypothetical protein